MPEFSRTFENKAISETVPGELFRISLRGVLAICINLQKEENGRILVGILKSEVDERPFYFFPAGKELACLSYGTNWVLEPVLGEESFPSNRGLEDVRRVLFLDGEGVLLRFDQAGNAGDFDALTADLFGNGIRDPGRNAVPVIHWKIWDNEDDRHRPEAMPLVSFGD